MRGISSVADQLLLCGKQRGVTAKIILDIVEKRRLFYFGKSDSAYCV